MSPPLGHGWLLEMLTDVILVVEQYLVRQPSGQVTRNAPLFLSQTDGRIGPIRSISWSCQVPAPIYFNSTVLFHLHSQQIPNPYLLGVRRQWLRVNCVERIRIRPLLKTWNRQRLENFPPCEYWSCISISMKANGFPPLYIPITSWTLWRVVEYMVSKKINITYGVF